jgi:Icc-related predicted phosphoesterase
VSVTVFYASDIHGADVVWRKFLNAAKFYGADVLIMGGDVTGKAVVPVVRRGDGFVARQVTGDRVVGQDELPDLESKIRDMGFYPSVMSEEEVEATHADDTAIRALFHRLMAESIERWLALAEERLAGTGIRLYLMTGNDDPPHLREVIDASPVAVDPEEKVIELAEGLQMASCGWSNTTPWNSPRELSEEELEEHLEKLIADLDDPTRSVFNFHVPPYGTQIDRAPVLDATLKPVVKGGAVMMESVGSRAVRNTVQRHQPALGLHGHIHESRGAVKIGNTVCINPGSEYHDGVLQGALIELAAKKGVRRYQLTSG